MEFWGSGFSLTALAPATAVILGCDPVSMITLCLSLSLCPYVLQIINRSFQKFIIDLFDRMIRRREVEGRQRDGPSQS